MNHSFARPYFVKHTRTSGGYLPSQVASFYNFPKVTVSTLKPVYLIELGGGYNGTAISQWCQLNNYPIPILNFVGLDGATNDYTGNPQSADVEVVLDICCVIGGQAAMTDAPANITVVFVPNSNQGFVDAINYVAQKGNCTCGISWGSAEKEWGTSAIAQMDKAFANGVANGVTYFVAAGDSGASDGESGLNADYPGSSPYVVCCGGTTIVVQNNQITNEVPWNEGGGATGGGFSAVEDAPSWQKGFIPAGQLRGVPDLCADADPETGYSIATFGVVGGTSAVAPLMAGFFGVANSVRKTPLGLVNPMLYANEKLGFRDIVAGNNSGYSSATGWDAASGLGSPLGAALFNILVNAIPNPPTPPTPPTPPVPPTPVAGPTLAQVLSVVNSTFQEVESKVGFMVRPYLAYTNSQVDANLTKLFNNNAVVWGKAGEWLVFDEPSDLKKLLGLNSKCCKQQ